MYSYDYMFEEDVLEFMEKFGFAFLGIVLGILLIVLVISIVLYVLRSAGLYTIAKSRGIKHAWLSWLPIGYYWVAGSIADQYQYVVKGKVKNKRKILLGLCIGRFAVGIVANVLSGFMMLAAGDPYRTMATGSMTSLLTLLLNVGVSVALFVFWHMSLYNIYSSCNPDNSVVFLVLGIVFSFTIPFFLFFNRKKENGMPPRRPEPQAYIPPEPRYTEPQEPWNEPEQL